MGPVLTPPLQALRNTINSQFAFVYPDPGVLAAGVAQGQIAEKTAREWASYHGVGDDAFTGLRAIADTGPPLAPALTLLRRGVWLPGQYTTALNRQAIESQWWDGLLTLQDEWLEPAEIAKAVHRGIMSADGLLIAAPPTEPGNVPAVPPSPISPITEAAGAGFNAERLRILVGNAGLPLGLHEMLGLMNRGYMTPSDVQRGIAESNLRNEYQDVALHLARRLLTPTEYAELDLRGWIDHAHRDAGAAMSGMTPEDADLLWKLHGRPLAIHQITTGLARGGQYNPVPGELTDPYQAAVRLSSLRPEFYDLDIANKYTMPSVFAIRGLAQSGAWDFDTTHTRLLWSGWYPPDAEAVARFWTQKTAAGLSPAIKSAQTRFITAIHKAYVGGSITDAQLTEQLALSLLDAADQAGVAEFYRKEKALEAIPPPAAA